MDVLSGSTAAKERARSYAAIVSSEAVAQKIKQNNPELSLSTGQIRSSLTATAGDNAALITVNARLLPRRTHRFSLTVRYRLPPTTSRKLSRTPVTLRHW